MDISIKKACHENWDSMSPNEQGAFCGKCVKTVIDFSKLSLDEIKYFFEGNSEQKICGRFEENQLRSLSFDAFFLEFKGFNISRRIAIIIYFTFGMCLFSTTDVQGQNNAHIKENVDVKPGAIMGGVRVVIPAVQDTVKSSAILQDYETKKITGKVCVEPTPLQEAKMGEVVAEPPKKKPIGRRIRSGK